jgi:ZIP family zinc transporter
MSQSQTLLLGVIAGSTILLGLPLGRLRSAPPGLRQFLNALAVGVLLFLFWDVVSHAFEPVDGALTKLHDGSGGVGPVLGYGALFLGGVSAGVLSLVYYERWLGARRRQRFGPGAMDVREALARPAGVAEWSPTRQLALLIAVGIGLHNFGEGLAIGSSAAQGAIGLAVVLVIGFALHNATEGFGIVAPLAAERELPSWRFLLLLGAIGGGPTFIGTVVGRQFTSDVLSVVFLTLAAGSILYVVVQMIGVGHKMGSKQLLYWGILAGLAAGFLTDMIVTAGGA